MPPTEPNGLNPPPVVGAAFSVGRSLLKEAINGGGSVLDVIVDPLLRVMLKGLLVSTALPPPLLPPALLAKSLLRSRSRDRDRDRRRSSLSKRLLRPLPPPFLFLLSAAADSLFKRFLAFHLWIAEVGSSFHISLASGAAWASLADTRSTACT